MYGGSGTWPIRSITDVTPSPRSGSKPDGAASEEPAVEHLRLSMRRAPLRIGRWRRASVSARDASARPRLRCRRECRRSARVRRSAGRGQADQQAFDGAAARDALAEQTRGKDPGVVDDEQIARRADSAAGRQYTHARLRSSPAAARAFVIRPAGPAAVRSARRAEAKSNSSTRTKMDSSSEVESGGD